jgi:hypothetical protein
MPLSHCLSAALDVMASSECGEAASGVSSRVLEEDVVLGFGAEMLHRGMERGTSEAAGLGRTHSWHGEISHISLENKIRTEGKRIEAEPNHV